MSEARRANRPEVLAEVSEWAVQELVVALSISSRAAEALLTRSLTLVHRLPATLAALETGQLHAGHLWPMLEKVAPICDGAVRVEVEAALLAWAAGRVTTPPQLAAKARRMVLARDARSAVARLTRALQQRGVSLRPDAVDGMAAVTLLLSQPEARALYDALGRYADAIEEPADASSSTATPRTRGQKMADVLLDLVLRPGETDLPPVQAQLTVVAAVSTMVGGDEPGEVGGDTVPAEVVRQLSRALGLLPECSPPSAARLQACTPNPDAEQREWEAWYAETEHRLLSMPWGGAEEPPPEHRARMEEREERWALLEPAGDWPEEQAPVAGVPAWDLDPADDQAADEPIPEPAPPLPGLARPGEAAAPESWSAADEAVQAAGAALLQLERAVGRASREVEQVERADAVAQRAWPFGSNGPSSTARDSLDFLARATEEQRSALAALLDATGGGGLVDRPRIAVVDALSGALLALTDSAELRRRSACSSGRCRRDPGHCTHVLTGRPGLRPPPPTRRYRPAAALDRWVRARDRRCRFPGCRAPVPGGGELDHERPWPDGPTSADNLTGYCTSHHRGKHQARGWRHALAPDGTLTVTTPTGLVAVTTPPPY